jgi:hypothetical protein
MRNGKVVDQLVGADPRELSKKIETQLANTSAAAAAAAPSAPGAGGYRLGSSTEQPAAPPVAEAAPRPAILGGT